MTVQCCWIGLLLKDDVNELRSMPRIIWRIEINTKPFSIGVHVHVHASAMAERERQELNDLIFANIPRAL